jgi:hypothetical protein
VKPPTLSIAIGPWFVWIRPPSVEQKYFSGLNLGEVSKNILTNKDYFEADKSGIKDTRCIK